MKTISIKFTSKLIAHHENSSKTLKLVDAKITNSFLKINYIVERFLSYLL